VKKHCTIGVVSPPSFMSRIVLAIFWAEYWGRSPGQRIDIQEKLMGGAAAGADWAEMYNQTRDDFFHPRGTIKIGNYDFNDVCPYLEKIEETLSEKDAPSAVI